MPKQFFAGSMNQAIRANPMSAIPSTVLSPGMSQSSILTPPAQSIELRVELVGFKNDVTPQLVSGDSR